MKIANCRFPIANCRFAQMQDLMISCATSARWHRIDHSTIGNGNWQSEIGNRQ